jgi:hypothetical protein
MLGSLTNPSVNYSTVATLLQLHVNPRWVACTSYMHY